jgi:hypothetical protein
MYRPLLAACLALLTTGCVVVEDPVLGPAACPVIESRDWTAFVNAMPGPGARPQLIVSGTVRLPSAGYSVALEPGIADRSARPVQNVELVAVPPEGPAATVVTQAEVRLEMASLAVRPGEPSPYRGVRVLCGGEELAFIAPVETAW